MQMYKKGDYKRYYYEDDNTIFGMFEDNRYLSNFHRCKINHLGYEWPSTEHAYMVSKVSDLTLQTQYQDIQNMTCDQVKRWGSTCELRSDWEELKYGFMFQITLEKYLRHSELRDKLLATGGKKIVEANSWGDQYWGYDVDKKSGENNLGKLLMEIRDNIL